MKKAIILMMAVTFLSLPVVLSAQTQNPRGIYKMTTLTGKQGEIPAPFDQYKICSDSITLTLIVQDAAFQIRDTDHSALNYTGSQPKDDNDKNTLVYDSDSNGFKLKWWNAGIGHPYFTDNSWCIEKYETNKYSETAQLLLDAFTVAPSVSKENLFLGTWRVLGELDELNNAKKALPTLHEKYRKSKYLNSFFVFTQNSFIILLHGSNGGINPVKYAPNSKKSYKWLMEVLNAKWIGKDCVAIENKQGVYTNYTILERVTDGQTMLGRIAGLNLSASGR